MGITEAPRRLIVNHYKSRLWFLLHFILGESRKSVLAFFDCSDEGLDFFKIANNYYLLLMSWFLQVFLGLIDKPLMQLGHAVEYFLNFLSQNGGFFDILMNFLLGKLKKPKRGTEDFLSIIAHLDPRIDLGKTGLVSNEKYEKEIAEANTEWESQKLMDLCVMAAKIAFENAKVIEKIVNSYWKMNFVGFYDCWNGRRTWNEKQKENNTQVFIFTDKPQDAHLIVISFRGTELFNAQDWITSLDFSWFEVPKVGKLHIGYLEGMGLGTRIDASSFESHFQRKDTNFFHLDAETEKQMLENSNNSAYYTGAIKLSQLLKENKNAKFMVTGHGLGGAFAIMFVTLLAIQDEGEIMQRLLNIYTFGQPRIGDEKLKEFMESHLSYSKYFRVVYSNDILPRVPFDDKFFHYKHFGDCLYYDVGYFVQEEEEEPNPNFFDVRYIIPMHLTAIYEVIRSFIRQFINGPEYKETGVSKSFRLIGLLLPGIASHSVVNYVNCVRLGRIRVLD